MNMMRKAAFAAVVALCATTAAASAQEFGIGAHIGTTGFGGDAALALNNHVAIHGSLGTLGVKPNVTFSDLEFKIEPPKTLMTVGVDLYPGTGSFHVSGGILTGAKTTKLTGTYTGTVTVGDHTYNGSELGTLDGDFETKQVAPYAGIGLGRHAASGFGLTLDLGVAFLGENDLHLVAPSTSLPPAQQAQFEADLEKERVSVQDDLRKYTKLLPMLSIGLRIGL
jgi:Spy/CpxP family protein refolding chaperone